MTSAEVDRVDAPPHWRAAEFISDLHLCPEAPRTFEAFVRYLEHTDADALFILGDLFELWIGDDARHLDFNAQCMALLRASANRRATYFICGNRDFLIGPQMQKDSALHVLRDPAVLHAFGQRLLLSHGDALCLDDVPYQAYRREVRSAPWQAEFLGRSIEDRLAIVRQIREESRQRKEELNDLTLWADVDGPEARRWLEATGSTILVHGHTHRPGDTDLGGGFSRKTLSDWDLDSPRDRAEVLRLGPTGWQRLPIRPAA